MSACIFTTQHSIWLDAALECNAKERITFYSNKKWVTAKKLLVVSNELPLLIRRQENETKELACQYLATLNEITFRQELANDAERLEWLHEKLSLQRQKIQNLPRTKQFPTWEKQYKSWEIDKFMKATTWYTFTNLRKIKPLALPRLRKLDGNHPIAPNFIRGYAICHYPAGEIEKVRTAGAGKR